MSNGLTLWANAGPNARTFLIRLACDGDKIGNMRRWLTIAQALEVTKSDESPGGSL